jgi:cyanophycinase
MSGLTHHLGRGATGVGLAPRDGVSRAAEPATTTETVAVVDELDTCSVRQVEADHIALVDSLLDSVPHVVADLQGPAAPCSWERDEMSTIKSGGRLAGSLPERWAGVGSPQASAAPRVEPVSASAVTKRAGQLVIIGGAEDRADEAVILRRFRDLCGGENARIAVLGTATRIPIEVGHDYTKAFRAIGVKEVVFLPLASRYEANAAETIEILERVDGVFFTGGDQQRISAIIGGSRVGVRLHQKFEQGLVIAGTSAGAAMMSSIMILGSSDTVTSTSAVALGLGLGFLPGVVIDMHFSERRRLPRLLAAVARFPHDLGIGIDEDTALIVDGSRLEVIGAGAVTIIDASEATSIVSTHDERTIALTDALIHVLATGYAFDLATRSAELTTGPEVERRLSQAS